MKKIIYKNPIANIKLNGERLNAFPLKLEQSKDGHSPLLFNIILEVLASATREGKGKEGKGREGKGCRSEKK